MTTMLLYWLTWLLKWNKDDRKSQKKHNISSSKYCHKASITSPKSAAICCKSTGYSCQWNTTNFCKTTISKMWLLNSKSLKRFPNWVETVPVNILHKEEGGNGSECHLTNTSSNQYDKTVCFFHYPPRQWTLDFFVLALIQCLQKPILSQKVFIKPFFICHLYGYGLIKLRQLKLLSNVVEKCGHG